jgi:hypothetical protein
MRTHNSYIDENNAFDSIIIGYRRQTKRGIRDSITTLEYSSLAPLVLEAVVAPASCHTRHLKPKARSDGRPAY